MTRPQFGEAGEAIGREAFIFPTSFAQERLWFLDRLEPESTAYNVPLLLSLKGELDVAALERAVSGLVTRHDALRTTFHEEDGIPHQLVWPEMSLPLDFVDVSDGVDAAAEALRVAGEKVGRRFDLAAGPLFRVSVIRIAEREHLLVLTLHHIVGDGWSLGVLRRDLSELYNAARETRPAVLPQLGVQYGDFAVWQREWLRGDRLEAQLAYWRQQLEEAPPVLELPTDRQRPPLQSFRGAHRRRTLPTSLLERLRTLSQEDETTLFMTLLAAFNTLLHRYTGRTDILVGSPIANRTRVELEPLIGFFANTLVLRTSLEDDPSFRELLRRTKEVTLDAYAHQDVPFEKLVQELNPERELSHSPLFQVLFAIAQPGYASDLAGIDATRLELERGTAKVDLGLFIAEGPRGLGASFEYATDLFDASTVDRMLAHYESILEAVAADPDRSVGGLSLLSVEERSTLSGWNRTGRSFAEAGQAAHVLVEGQVVRSPDAPAVRFGGLKVSYRELNERANRLARRLRVAGVGADVPVGICLPRSVDLVVSVLAVLKAGGAYAPLDPAYPAERLGLMIEDLGTPVLLTQSGLLGVLPEHDGEVLCLDLVGGELAGYGSGDLEPLSGPEDLAYVLFTSGSTGRPKGVAMPHRPLTNLLSWQLRSWTAPSAARTLQFASLSFDVAFQELFSTWWSGGTLVLLDEDTRRDAEALLRFLDEERVERVFLPFVALQNLADASLELGVMPQTLREVITAGEALQVTEAIRRFFERSGAALHNQYGPTESHVVTAHRLQGPPSGWPLRPPIGRPIDNARIEILDRYGNQVPVGVTGDLHIGGPVLARGYLNRPELTSERFSQNPYGQGRLYRTGDLARYLADGTIEYLGRADQQVKLRGYRIELGEIEAILRTHPAVRDAVAHVREDVPGDKRLVAYTLAESTQQPTSDHLRAFLKQQLPDFMIPTAFVPLQSLPISPNGKLDRQALPAPDGTRPDLERFYVAPTTPVEETLVSIWREVLAIDRVGIEDDFFGLGGHSLLATRVVSRVRAQLGVELPLRALFEQPTVKALSARINEMPRGQGPDEPQLVAVPRKGR
jgi:amino acid adenylation domain-containing protein